MYGSTLLALQGVDIKFQGKKLYVALEWPLLDKLVTQRSTRRRTRLMLTSIRTSPHTLTKDNSL